jgi:hypothetical protein
MLLLATAALLAASPSPATAGATVQARATVRIVSAVRLKFGGSDSGSGNPPPREAIVRTEAGPQRAKLIEFE